MGYQRRATFEILLDIIIGTKQAINKTRLMSKTNIAHKPFKRYSYFLEKIGFITKIPPPPLSHNRRKKRKTKFHYIITNKGIELLNQISQEPFSEILSYRDHDIMEEIS